jgi:hypothetical protein
MNLIFIAARKFVESVLFAIAWILLFVLFFAPLVGAIWTLATKEPAATWVDCVLVIGGYLIYATVLLAYIGGSGSDVSYVGIRGRGIARKKVGK